MVAREGVETGNDRSVAQRRTSRDRKQGGRRAAATPGAGASARGPSRSTSAQAPPPRRPRAGLDEEGEGAGPRGAAGPQVIPLTREDECGARDVQVVLINHSAEDLGAPAASFRQAVPGARSTAANCFVRPMRSS